MGHKAHVEQFNPNTFKETASKAASRSASNFAQEGTRVVELTGKLHEYVDPKVKPRISHNSLVQREDGLYVMTEGPTFSAVSFQDATRSFEQHFKKTFLGIGRFHSLLDWLKKEFNVQLSTGIVQDRLDQLVIKKKGNQDNQGQSLARTMWQPEQETVITIPNVTVQQSMYESTTAIADQMLLLQPANHGHDWVEDYQLMLIQLLMRNQWDSLDFYGRKPYGFLTADEIGRDWIESKDVEANLGFTIQGNIETIKIGQALVQKMHFFYLSVSNDPDTERWWTRMIGAGRYVKLPKTELGAETQAALIYVSENSGANRSEVVDMLRESTKQSDNPVSLEDARLVFDAIVRAGVAFGAQPKVKMPKKGDVFKDVRDPWPIDEQDPRPTPPPSGTPSGSTTPTSLSNSGDDEIPWGKL